MQPNVLNKNQIKNKMNCHFIMVEEFECPNDPRSYVVEGNLPLVGFPKANWS